MATQETINAGATGSDVFVPQPDHEREQGQPGSTKSAFSHANEFKDGETPGVVDNSAPADSVESLSADTGAQDHGNSKFMASLEEAKQKQEENHSTAI